MFSITSSSGPISSALLREKLSVDSTHSVTTGIPSLVAPLDELLELVRAGLVAGHQRLARSVGPGPSPVAVGQHRDVPRQPAVVEFGDQSMLVRGVEQARWVQPVHELSQPVKSGHVSQRIPRCEFARADDARPTL